MKNYDLSNLRKSVTKGIPGLSIGFSNPKIWISTGNYSLNYRISGSFFKGIPLGKVTVMAGETGSGKSYICSGNLIREAQKKGIFCILIDTENALDEDWLKRLGVDTSEDKLLKVNMSMIDDLAKFMSQLIKNYKEIYGSSGDESPGILVVVDSLGMMVSATDVEQFQKGDLKGDMGRKPKQLAALVRNLVNSLGDLNIGLVATNHTYASQDQFDPEDKISGGQGFLYAASIVVAIKKLKLKEDDEGNKISDVTGIRAKCKILKSRFSKPYEEVEIKIPWYKGMDPFSGLFDILEKEEKIFKEGNRYVYKFSNGETVKLFRKEFESDQELLLKIMNDIEKRNIGNENLHNEQSEREKE